MKLLPGYTFKTGSRTIAEFKPNATYRIFRISPIKESIEYIFQSKDGNISHKFKSTEEAESVIAKLEA